MFSVEEYLRDMDKRVAFGKDPDSFVDPGSFHYPRFFTIGRQSVKWHFAVYRSRLIKDWI